MSSTGQRRFAARCGARALVLLGLLFVCPATDAAAQGAKGKAKAAKVAVRPLDRKAQRAIEEKLASRDPDRMIEAISAAQSAGVGATAVAGPIETILARGTTVPIAKAAIDALAAIGAASSSAAVRPYLKHRVVDLRRAAVRALLATKGPEAIAGLREGLRSGDGIVRGLAASGLGGLGAAEAVPDLFLALDRGVTEAAASIGQLCTGEACDRFTAKLGKIGLDVMTSGIDKILFREPPVAEDTLVKLVAELFHIGTPEARRYLADVRARWPANGSARVKQALDSALSAMPAGP